jgi:hypothetical protein
MSYRIHHLHLIDVVRVGTDIFFESAKGPDLCRLSDGFMRPLSSVIFEKTTSNDA